MRQAAGYPFALSLAKGRVAVARVGFDKLSPNGSGTPSGPNGNEGSQGRVQTGP